LTYLIGVDLGTSGCKVILFDAAGSPVASDYTGYPLNLLGNGMVEQNPEDWWDAVCASMRKVMKIADISSTEVASIGCGGQFPDLVTIDRDGRALRPAIAYSDVRGRTQSEQIFDRLGREEVTKLTGLPACFFPSLPASKILWIRQHEPELEKHIYAVMGAKDFLNFRLTGQHAIDYVEAWWTGLVMERGYSWWDEMLERLRIPRSWLGDIRKPTDVIGELTETASKVTSLAPGTPVVCGSVDGMCNVVGSGILEPGIMMDASGTTEIMASLSTKKLAPSIGDSIFCWRHLDPEKWVVYTSTATAGASLRWFSEHFAEAEKAEAARTGVSVYNILDRQAETVEAGAEMLLFWPYLAGEYAPFYDFNVRGVFLGITLDKERKHFVRAILEGVAFSMNHVIEAFSDLGLKIQKIRTGGGGSKSRLWNQIKADVTGKTVQVTKVNELGCTGAAILAGIGAGVFSGIEEATRSAVPTVEEFTSNTRNHETYSKLFRVYKEKCSLLRDISASLSSSDSS